MTDRQRSTENDAKDEGEGGASLDLGDDETLSSMDKFKSLAKRLIRVPRSELDGKRELRKKKTD